MYIYSRETYTLKEIREKVGDNINAEVSENFICYSVIPTLIGIAVYLVSNSAVGGIIAGGLGGGAAAAADTMKDYLDKETKEGLEKILKKAESTGCSKVTFSQKFECFYVDGPNKYHWIPRDSVRVTYES